MRWLVVGLLSLAGTHLVAAQTLSFGVKTGLSRSNQADLSVYSPPSGIVPRWAPTIGLSAAKAIAGSLHLQVEANYVAKGYWAPSYALNVDYLELPILARVLIPLHRQVHPALVAGIAPALRLGCSEDDHRIGISETIYAPGFECAGRRANAWDGNLVLAAGIEVGKRRTRATLELRHTRAFTNLYSSGGNARGYNRTTSFLVGLAYDP